MRKEEARREETQRRRARSAALAVLAVCLLATMAGAAGCAAEGRLGSADADAGEGSLYGVSPNMRDGSYVAAVWDGISGGADLEGAVEQAGFACVDGSSAPAWFEREVAPIGAFDRVFANSDETLFELQAAGSKESVLDDICGCMADRGWQRSRSGMDGVDTFTKTEGDVRWAMLECSETDGVCCMVLHIQPS